MPFSSCTSVTEIQLLAVLWSFQSTEFSETPSPDSDSVNSVEGHSEPSWFKDIKFDDSDTEQIAEEGDDNLASKFGFLML